MQCAIFLQLCTWFFGHQAIDKQIGSSTLTLSIRPTKGWLYSVAKYVWIQGLDSYSLIKRPQQNGDKWSVCMLHKQQPHHGLHQRPKSSLWTSDKTDLFTLPSTSTSEIINSFQIPACTAVRVTFLVHRKNHWKNTMVGLFEETPGFWNKQQYYGHSVVWQPDCVRLHASNSLQIHRSLTSFIFTNRCKTGASCQHPWTISDITYFQILMCGIVIEYPVTVGMQSSTRISSDWDEILSDLFIHITIKLATWNFLSIFLIMDFMVLSGTIKIWDTFFRTKSGLIISTALSSTGKSLSRYVLILHLTSRYLTKCGKVHGMCSYCTLTLM